MKIRIATVEEWRAAATKAKRVRVDARDQVRCLVFNASRPTLWAEAEERLMVTAVRRLHRVAVVLLG